MECKKIIRNKVKYNGNIYIVTEIDEEFSNEYEIINPCIKRLVHGF